MATQQPVETSNATNASAKRRKHFVCEYTKRRIPKRVYIPDPKDPKRGTHTFLDLNCAVAWINTNAGRWRSGLAERYKSAILKWAKEFAGVDDVPPAPPLGILQEGGFDAWRAAYSSSPCAPPELTMELDDPRMAPKRSSATRRKVNLISQEVAHDAATIPTNARRRVRAPFCVVVNDRGRRGAETMVTDLDKFVSGIDNLQCSSLMICQLEASGDITLYPLLSVDPAYVASTQLRVHVSNFKI